MTNTQKQKQWAQEDLRRTKRKKHIVQVQG